MWDARVQYTKEPGPTGSHLEVPLGQGRGRVSPPVTGFTVYLGPGVIAGLIDLLQHGGGTTVELYAKLNGQPGAGRLLSWGWPPGFYLFSGPSRYMLARAGRALGRRSGQHGSRMPTGGIYGPRLKVPRKLWAGRDQGVLRAFVRAVVVAAADARQFVGIGAPLAVKRRLNINARFPAARFGLAARVFRNRIRPDGAVAYGNGRAVRKQ